MTRVLPPALLLAMVISATPAESGSINLFVQLIYGTNSEKPPDKRWIRIGPSLRKGLSPVFQWNEYWQVSCTQVAVKTSEASKIRLADERELEIRLQPDGRLQFTMYRDGNVVRKLKNMRSTERIIMGGDRKPDDAWFVVVRRDKPSTE